MTENETIAQTRNNTKWLKRWGVTFTETRQPSPEAKAAGWERKREAKRILDQMLLLGKMSHKEYKAFVNQDKDKLTVNDMITIKYIEQIMNGKLLPDWLNRSISYAPREVTGEDGGAIIVKMEVELPTRGGMESLPDNTEV